MQPFPELLHQGNAVNAPSHVQRGTGFAFAVGLIVAATSFLMFSMALIIVTHGFFLLALLFSPLFGWLQNRKARAMIHGSGVKIDENQFPQIDAVVRSYSERLGIEPPDVYIVEDTVMNAFAVKYGRKNLVVLTDDIVHAALLSGNPKSLNFVIGHELAHVALNHNGMIRRYVKGWFKKLSRLDEYSADRVALHLVPGKKEAVTGLIMLTIGPHLLPYMNLKAILAQVEEVVKNKYSFRSEKPLTHPLLLNRVNAIMMA